MDEVSQKPESIFRTQVTKFLDTLPKTWFTSVQQLAINGTPDILICCRGKFFAVEIKTNEGEATPLQKKNLGDIERSEGRAYLLRPKNFSEFKRELLGLTRSKFV